MGQRRGARARAARAGARRALTWGPGWPSGASPWSRPCRPSPRCGTSGRCAGVRLLILGGEACPPELGWRLAEEPRGVEHLRADRGDRRRDRARDPPRCGRSRSAGRCTAGRSRSSTRPASRSRSARTGELVIGGVGLGRYLDPVLDAERYARAARAGLGARLPHGRHRARDRRRPGLHRAARRSGQARRPATRARRGRRRSCAPCPACAPPPRPCRETAAGNKVLVGYVVGDVNPAQVRARSRERFPTGLVPLMVVLDALPTRPSGKVDRKALPWPPPARSRVRPTRRGADRTAALAGRAVGRAARAGADRAPKRLLRAGRQLAGRRQARLGALRERFPSRRGRRHLQPPPPGRAERAAGRAATPARRGPPSRRRAAAPWGAVSSPACCCWSPRPQWLLAILAVDRLYRAGIGPAVGWGWLIAGWIVFGSAAGRALIVAARARLLLADFARGATRATAG